MSKSDLELAKERALEKIYADRGIIIFNKRLKIINVSNDIEKYVGMTKEMLLNKNLKDINQTIYDYLRKKKLLLSLKESGTTEITLEITLEISPQKTKAINIEVLAILDEKYPDGAYITCLCKILNESLTPICSNCKSIRLLNNTWISIETYLVNTYYEKLTHGMCSACMKVLYPELKKFQ